MVSICKRCFLSWTRPSTVKPLYRARTSVTRRRISMSSNEASIRLALPEDYDEVMSMTSQDPEFHNQDFLFSQYFKWLEEPYMRCLVRVKDRQLVAFCISQFGLDNGDTAVIHSVRCAKEFRREGHVVEMMKFVQRLDPRKEFLASVTEGTEMYRYNSEGVFMRNQYSYSISEYDPNVKAKTHENDTNEWMQVQELNVEEFCQLFNFKSLNDYLYPHGYFIADDLIAKPNIANAKFVRERTDNMAIFICRPLLPHVENNRFSNDLNNTDPLSGIISLNTWYPCRGGFASKIQLFGQVDKPQDLESHLKAHVQVLRANRLFGPVQVRLDRDRLGMKETELRKICQTIGLTAQGRQTCGRHIQRMKSDKRVSECG